MSVLEVAIGWLAPPDCIGCGQEGQVLCEGCLTSEILPFGERCWNCNALSLGGRTCPKCRRTGGPHSVWITTDYDSLASDLVRQYKFGHLRAAAKPLAMAMADTFWQFNGEIGARKLDYLVVPVPTATARARQRGFGHAELLAKHVVGILQMEYAVALRRLGQSRQLGASRQDRLRQLSDSFAVKSPNQIAGRNVLLVDDVITTGGTLTAATKTLRVAGARRVDALLFAKKL